MDARAPVLDCNLIDQFQQDETRQRALDYGGSIVNRAHFLPVSADAVRKTGARTGRRAAVAGGVMRR
jgi:2,4-dienoyl-CoA reductase-like NADH-dependent reductase (Old Yellow Enzyme family)